jgi:O-antigen ligase
MRLSERPRSGAPGRGLPPWAGSALVVPAAVLAWLMGAAVARGGLHQAAALAMAGVGLLLLLAAWAGRRLRYGILTVELPVVLLLMSNQTLRIRSTQELAANPLDAAGQFRVVGIGLAGLLGLAALLSSRTAVAGRLTSLPLRLYIGYVLVVFVGVPFSADPFLTLYRGVELTAALLVLLGARRRVGEAATGRIESALYWCTVVLVASVWLGVVLFPSKAIAHLADQSIPIPYSLQGVLPAISSNAVGTLGVMLMFWSLARMRSGPLGRLRPRAAYLLAALGLVTLIFAQYRTGYIAAIVSLLLILLVGRKWNLAALLLLAAVAVVLWKPSLVGDAAPYLLRGQTVAQAQELSGRVTWWEAALPVWEKSPLIGRGLLTASRFEVFARMGQYEVAGLHSTWIEALLGTGLIGLALLAVSFIVSARRALAAALQPHPWIVPVVLLGILGIRSLTGNTFESFQYEALVFLWVAWALQDPSPIGSRQRQPLVVRRA